MTDIASSPFGQFPKMKRRQLKKVHFGFLERMKSGEVLTLTVVRNRPSAMLGETTIHPQYVADMVSAEAIRVWRVEELGRQRVAYHYELLEGKKRK